MCDSYYLPSFPSESATNAVRKTAIKVLLIVGLDVFCKITAFSSPFYPFYTFDVKNHFSSVSKPGIILSKDFSIYH